MPLVNMKEMLQHAYDNAYAVGAFDLVSLDFLQGIMLAAERCQSPVILSLAESHFDYFDFELIMPAVETAARRASVPVAIHLDHGFSLESAVRAINSGCNGVMVDASQMNFTENCLLTKSVVDTAHACGISVEGELGYVPGVEGEDAEHHPGDIAYTSVTEASSYVKQTGVDFLAVSIGTVHGHMQGKPKLDFQCLQEINETLHLPLVIHGGTGLSEDQFRQLIANGVCKINYYTALSDVAAIQIGENFGTAVNHSYTGLLENTRSVIADETERCMRLWGCAERAAEVLNYCQPWGCVEHLIIYNVDENNKHAAEKMMAEGRQILSAIPGVRKVFTGEAVKQEAGYRYSWQINFCHPAVIDSYRVHPDHVAFADMQFRPIAGERISIDYLSTTEQRLAEN